MSINQSDVGILSNIYFPWGSTLHKCPCVEYTTMLTQSFELYLVFWLMKFNLNLAFTNTTDCN